MSIHSYKDLNIETKAAKGSILLYELSMKFQRVAFLGSTLPLIRASICKLLYQTRIVRITSTKHAAQAVHPSDGDLQVVKRNTENPVSFMRIKLQHGSFNPNKAATIEKIIKCLIKPFIFSSIKLIQHTNNPQLTTFYYVKY